ncbi:MAG: phosphoglycerate kinase [Nitrososphaerota archaeon]
MVDTYSIPYVNFLTMDDLDLAGKTIFLRADINSPVDPYSGRLLNKVRIKEAAVTIRELSSSKVVVGSHQGRVGNYDYVSLREHAEVLKECVGGNVKFIDDVIGPAAREAIKNLKSGEILVLDNLRFVAEENFEFSIEDASKTHMVKTLKDYFDVCILEAFPTAHRANPSIVGFAEVLPTCGGRLLTQEVNSLLSILQKLRSPITLVLGGAKVSDRIESIEALISSYKVDKILPCGLLGVIFLKATKDLNVPTGIKDEEKYIKKAEKLLSEFKETFILPEDFAVEMGGKRKELTLSQFDSERPVLDIGMKTVSKYTDVIRNSGTVIVSGPPGAYEKKNFDVGTKALLMELANSRALSIVSGAHTLTALEFFGLRDKVTHATSAGGALIKFLSGKKLPLFDALKRAAEKWKTSK